MEYQAVIGLEVHVHLKTKTKAFCGCSSEFGNTPNSQICPVCLGLPGSLPVLNKLAFDYAIKVGLALNCTIQKFTKFDRKNYFYPDLPKNYQISQYDLPISINGFLNIELEGEVKNIRIKRVHLEEDAGKLIHKETMSLVDFNRSGIPLLEIVTEPDINSPQEAFEYLTSLKSILEYLEVSDCDMEKGSLRCDANISIREKGISELGTKTELKNMNSFKGVKDALDYEIQRQISELKKGQKIIQETRLWDAKALVSIPMRSKEEAQDYRYFPEPDLPAFIIHEDKIEDIKRGIPELPTAKILRFTKEFGLAENDAKIIVFLSKNDAIYAEECFRLYKNKDKKLLVNFIIGPLLYEANIRNCHISNLKANPEHLVELIQLIEENKISNLTAKQVLKEINDTGKKTLEIIQEKNLIQISDTSLLESKIEEVIKENPGPVQDFKTGKSNAIMFLVGQLMKKTAGRANPKVAQEMLKRRLENV